MSRMNAASQTTPVTDLDLTGIDGVVIGHAVGLLTPRTRSRAIVEATASVGMFGTKYNTDAPGRKSIHVHPYPWTAAGSSVVPVLRDLAGLLHVGVVHNVRRDRGKKIYRLPEGYMHPKGCPELNGGFPTTFQPNDEAEIKIAFQNVSHTDAYAQHPALPAEAHDQDLFATAIRESHEEISIQVNREQLKFLAQIEEDGKIHSIVNYFLANLNHPEKTFSALPVLQSSDPGEIDETRWIQPQNIVQSDTRFFVGDYEILPSYAKMIGHAVLEFRRQELCKSAQKNISTSEDLYDLINPFIADVNLEELIDIKTGNYFAQLGEIAESRHQQSMILAKLYNDRIRGKKMADVTTITRAELEDLIRVAPEEESRFAFR